MFFLIIYSFSLGLDVYLRKYNYREDKTQKVFSKQISASCLLSSMTTCTDIFM